MHSIVFNAEGTLAATAIGEPVSDTTRRGVVRLWRVTDTGLLPLGAPLPIDDAAPAKSVSFHPAGAHLAVGTDSGLVQIWDITDPQRPADPLTLAGPTKGIGQLAFSPDGAHLAACGADGATHLWGTRDAGAPVATSPVTTSTWANSVAFSPDSTRLAIGSSHSESALRVVDTTTHEPIAVMPHPAPVTAVRFTPDGQDVLTAANDGTVRNWPLPSPALPTTSYAVSSTRFTSDGATLAVGSRDLRLYDMADPLRPRQLGPATTNPDGFSGALAFGPGDRVLAESHGKSGTIRLYDLSDRAHPRPLGPDLRAHDGQVEHLSYSPDGALIATGGRDGRVHLWDVTRPDTPIRLSTPGAFAGTVHWTAFNPRGNLLVAGSADRTLRLWDVSDPRNPVQRGEPLTPAPHYVYSTVFSPDGRTLAVSLGDSTVRLYDITDPGAPRQIGQPLEGPTDYGYSVTFDDTGTTLAGAFNDSTVWIWDLSEITGPRHRATLTLPDGDVFTIAFQPGQHRLAASGADLTPRIWTSDVDQAAALVCSTTGTPITEEEWTRNAPGVAYLNPCPQST